MVSARPRWDSLINYSFVKIPHTLRKDIRHTLMGLFSFKLRVIEQFTRKLLTKS